MVYMYIGFNEIGYIDECTEDLEAKCCELAPLSLIISPSLFLWQRAAGENWKRGTEALYVRRMEAKGFAKVDGSF